MSLPSAVSFFSKVKSVGSSITGVRVTWSDSCPNVTKVATRRRGGEIWVLQNHVLLLHTAHTQLVLLMGGG